MNFGYRADGNQRLTYQNDLHRPLSLYWGASGKAILAFLPDDEIEQILRREGASPASGEKPPSLRARMAELREVRERDTRSAKGKNSPAREALPLRSSTQKAFSADRKSTRLNSSH